jgi:hypothetical protein
MRRIIIAAVILFVLLCAGAKDVCVFAKTAENEPISVDNEKSDPAQIDPSAQVDPSAQANPSEELSFVEPLAQRKPELIRETVESVIEPWGSTKGFGEKIDWMHATFFKLAQRQVEKVDRWFKPPQGEQRIVELSRFRVGVFSEVKKKADKQLEVKPVVDFDTHIELPNMRRQIKLIITTDDPTTLPGTYVTEQQDKSLRTALTGQLMTDVSTSIGVRARWKPQLFANAVWAHALKSGNWSLYPQQKFYWENEKGLGEISTVVIDHWINRWNTRLSTSVKWSKQDSDADRQTERKDAGFRWSEVFIFDHANELLDETQLGRLVSGYDVANGYGIRLAAFGGFHNIDEYQAGIFFRRPLRKKWLYLLVEPDIDWKKINNWNPERTIKFGVEILFWGRKER